MIQMKGIQNLLDLNKVTFEDHILMVICDMPLKFQRLVYTSSNYTHAKFQIYLTYEMRVMKIYVTRDIEQ